jgi:hypothetical protein
VQVPANNGYYKAGQVTVLSGTAADTVSVVKTLQLFIQRNSDGLYWQDLESPADGFGVWGAAATPIIVSTSNLPNWSYTLGNETQIWAHNAAYKVWMTATDLPGNAQTSYIVGTSSNGFTYDTQFATSVVVVPVNGDYYNATTKPLPVISGTAVDETLGNRVASVGYSIKENGSGLYWDVGSSTFNAGGELFNALSFSNPNVWTSTHPPLQDGLVYAVRTRATDLAGNVETPQTARTFTFDISSPTAGIALPVNRANVSSLPTISGTVADNTGTAGIQTVELAIQVDTGAWFNDGSGAFDITNPEHFFTAITTNNFTTWFTTGIPFVSGHTYSVKSRATDKATNVQMVFSAGISTISFVFDNSKPTSGVTFPDGTQVLSSIPQVQGTASDNYAGVRAVYTSVGQVLSNGVTNYFNGAAFGAATEYFNLATWTGTNPWSYSATIPYTSGLRYLFHSYAVDVASNTETALAPVIVAYYDVTKPTTSLTSPLQGTYRSELNSITGNAYDKTAGIAALASGGVQVRVLQVGGSYWGGTSFNQTDGAAAWTNANAGTPSSWSYNDPTLTSMLVSSVTYLVQVRAADQAVPANVGPTSNGTNSNFTQGVDSVTVIVDLAAPTSRLLLPTPGATNYFNALPVISGTSVDTISGITTAGQVAVSIREANPLGAWWSGASTFTAVSEQFNPVSALSASNSTWTLTSPNFKHGTAYLVRVRASDNVVPIPNVESVNLSSAVFVYDVQYPTATVVFPGNGSIISSLASLSGTSFDEFVTSGVYVTMRDDATLSWWDQVTTTFTRTDITKLFYQATPASPGVWTTWTWPFDSTKLTTGRSYTVHVYGVDAAGNIQPVSAGGFTWDKTDPTSIVTLPVDNSFVGLGHFTTISGTANDVNDIQTVELSIQRLSDNDWWDTSTNNWTPVGPLYIGTGATIDGPTGSHPRGFHLNASLPPDNKLTADVQYRVKSRATDVPGNVQQTLDAGVVFRYDINSPDITIQYPQNGLLYPSIAVLSGTAQDNFNTKRVELRLKNGNNEYWDGGAFVASPNTWVVAVGSTATSGVVNWTYSTVPAWPNQTFELNARALDEAGNYSVVYATNTFTYDDVPPVSITTFPVSGVTYKTMARIYGTVSDGAAPRDISETRIQIRQITAGGTTYWDGGSDKWTGSVALSWNLVSQSVNQGGSLYNWNYADTNFTAPPLTWTSGTTYYIVTRAIDLAGNVAIESSTKTFVFDNTPPTSTPINPLDQHAYKSSALTVLSGTMLDATSPIQNVQLSIFDTDASRYYNGSTFTATAQTFLDASQLFSTSWTYNSGGLSFINGHHYVVISSASDTIGNMEVPGAGNTFLLDDLNPVSGVVTPLNSQTYTPTQTVFGTASDPGFTSGISGTGSGVKSSLGWHQGKAQVLILRDEVPVNSGGGPVSYGSWGAEDYFWNGSTWTSTTGGPVWVDASNMDSLGNWTYLGIVNNWVKGKFYATWVRGVDNAGNVQNSIAPGPKFQIAAPAASFNVTGLSDGQSAGFDHTVTVEAIDNEGFRATAYQGTILFTAPGGLEGMDSDDTADDVNGLPKSYTFTPADAGIHTFTSAVRFRLAGARQLRVEDSVDGSIFGVQSGVNITPAVPERLLVVVSGQTYNPGESPAPLGNGLLNLPTPSVAGNIVVAQIKLVDKYWNVTPSSSPTVNVVTSDPYDTDPGSMVLNSGTSTINIAMTTAGNQTITASGAGASNTSDTIVIQPKSADRMVAVLPGETRTQGKYNVAPFGKSGVVSQIFAGTNMTVTVYAVDQYYNLDTSGSQVIYPDLPNDDYDVTPSSQSLNAGATSFMLTPVTAGTQVVRSTGAFVNGTYTSPSFTVYPDTTMAQVRLQLVFSGESPVPGLPPYAQLLGGKTGTPQEAYAGLGSTVTLRLVDRFYNLISVGVVMPIVDLTTDDPNDNAFGFDPETVTLANGVAQTTITFVTQNNSGSSSVNPARSLLGWQVTATDRGGHYATAVSTWIATWPNDIVKLRMLPPGQDAVEGTDPAGTGKTGGATAATAGQAYPITVQAVDQYWNRNLGLGPRHNANTGQRVAINTNDAFAVNNATTSMFQGENVFSTFQPRTAQTNFTFTANDVDDPNVSSQTVSGVTVNAAGATRFQIILPGETPVPGSGITLAGGKTGTPSQQTAGTAIPAPGVEVRLTDDYWNPMIGGALPWVTLTAPEAIDKYAVMPSSKQMSLSAGIYRATFISTVTFRTSGLASTHRLTASGVTGSTYTAHTSPYFTVVPNVLSRLQILMPGESADPGRPAGYSAPSDLAGKQGQPDADGLNINGIDPFIAGVSYQASVNATDSYYNVISTNILTGLASSDANGTPSNVAPLARTLVNGATGYPVTFLTAQDAAASSVLQTLTVSGGGLVPDVTPLLPVSPNVSTRIQILLPGETAAPGTALGKTGAPTAATAGVAYTIKARLTDAYYNAIGNAVSPVGLFLTSTDPFDTPDPDSSLSLPVGVGNYETTYAHSFQVATTTGWTVRVSTSSGPAYVADTAGPIVVNPDTNPSNTHNILILLPGETFVPGKVTGTKGRSGVPDFTAVLGSSVPHAGDSFPVTVLAVDQFYNRVFDNENPLVQISADPFLFPSYAPSNAFTLTQGSATVNVVLRRSTGTASLTVIQPAPSTTIYYSTGTSSTFSVTTNNASKLQVLVPGETAVPGSSTGKTGAPFTQTAGVMFTATVRATDDYYNPVPTAGAQVDMTTTDPYDTPTTQTQSLIAGATTYAVRFFTANPAGWQLNVSTSFGTYLASTASASIPVVPNSATRLLVVAPGESPVPGSVATNGISGSPSAQAAGSVWIATVTVVDDFYNLVSTATGNIYFLTSDPYDIDNATRTLISGTTGFAVQMVQAGTQTLSMYSQSGTYLAGTVTGIPIVAGGANRLLTILPGETYLPGKPPYTAGTGTGGKFTPDSPSSQVAGTPFTVSVYATDAFWNQAVSVATVTLSAPNDPNPDGTGTLHLSAGATSYSVTLYKAIDYNGFNQFFGATAAGFTNPGYNTPNLVVYPDTVGPRKLRMRFPSEVAAPGTVAGKTGTPTGPAADTHFTSGIPVTITMEGTDTWGNILDVGSTATFTTDDVYSLPNPRDVPLTHGTSTFSHVFITERTNDAGEITTPNATTVTASTNGFTSQIMGITVDDDDSIRNLQILVQGETAVPGSGLWPAGGKIGTPNSFAAGANIPITVRVVDNYWNLVEVPQVGSPQIELTATDPNVSVPLLSGAPTTAGILNTTVQLRTLNVAPGWTITSTGVASGFGFNQSTSAAIPITAAALARLQILVPGESPTTGTATGKTGVPLTQVAGNSFNIPIGNIRAVDAFYNPVSSTGTVTVTMRDPFGLPQTQTFGLSAGANPAVVPITLKISTATFLPQELYVNGLGVATSTSSAIPVNPNTATKLQLLLPGETAVPGSSSGKTGTPSSVAAGDVYFSTVNLTDAYYNVVPQASQPKVSVQTVDPFAFASAGAAQTLALSGTANFSITFQRADNAPGWIVQASTASGSAWQAAQDLSSAVVVLSTTTDRLQLVLPGQTAVPGSTAGGARGLSGSPAAAIAGVDYLATVNLTDRFYNLRTDIAPLVQIQTTDPYDVEPATRTLTNGTTTFIVQFHTAPGPWTINASTTPSYLGSPLYDFTSAGVTVNPGSPTKLQVLLPGETAVQGKPPYDSGELGGKIGSPDGDLVAGGIQPFVSASTFDVTVNLVDQYFNRAASPQNTFVQLSANDPYNTLPSMGQRQTGALGYPSGQTAFVAATLITRNTTPGWQIIASTSTGDAYAIGKSTWVPVTSGALQRLLVLAPGEQSIEGNPVGKSTDTATPQTAGAPFTLTVRAVDANYNIVTTTNSLVSLTLIGNSDSSLDDPFSEPTKPNAKNLIAGTTTFDLYLVTAEDQARVPANKQTVVIATAATLTPGYSGAIVMNPGITDQFQILLPGETAVPGSTANNARGHQGVPDLDGINGNGIQNFVAGTPLNVQIRAVDAYWNKTAATPPNMTLTSTDPNDLGDPKNISLTAGATTVSWTFNTANPAPGWQLTADDGPAAFNSYASTTIPVSPGIATQLQILLPGEIAAPGTPTGKTGTPSPWIAGVTSAVVVNVVDSNWNVVPTASLSVRLSNDTDVFSSSATLPLINGTTTFTFTLFTASATSTFSAARTSGQALSVPAATSAGFTITANTATRLQALVAGETAVPGKPPYNGNGGRTGTPDYDLNSINGQTAFPAGFTFPVTVRSVDNYYNLVQPNVKVQLTTEDPFDAAVAPQVLSAGTTVFYIFMQTANQAPGWTITASTTSDSVTSLGSNTTPVVPVKFGTPAKLQLVLPGETAVPGSTAGGTKGKMGSPSVATTGVEYDATVSLTDAFYNVVTGGSMPTVSLTSTDPFDVESAYAHGNPQSLDPSTGNGTIGVFFHTSSSWTLTATDISNTYQADTSTTVFVQPNLPTQFLVILPGESYVPGSTTGKSGTPNVITAGENTSATFLITDLYYNLVSIAQNPINITTDDLYDTDPGAFAMAGGSLTVSSFNLRTARAATLITVADADASAPALGSANSAAFTVAPSTAVRLQLVLPGETVQPGNAALTRGVVGSPLSAQSGISIPVQVRLTDTYWNLTTASSAVRLTSSDPFDQSTGPWVGTGKDPYDFSVTNGSGTFNFPLISISTGGWVLSASDTDDNPAPYPLRFNSFTSTRIVVNAGTPTKLITVLPGETMASGTQNGKTGTPSTVTAGVEIDVQVYVADAFNNVVTVPPAVSGTNTGDLQVSVEGNTDPYAVIPTAVKAVTPVSGFSSFQMTMYKAGVHTIAGDDVTLNRALPWTRSLSSPLIVQPSTATHLLALMPGETPLPGSGAPGKTGSPSVQVAGATFTVTVQIVDDYFNPQPSHTTENLRLDTSDLYDTQPGTATYTNGTASDGFLTTLRTAGLAHTVTAVDTNELDGATTWLSSVSGPFTVVASSASRFLTILPGETWVPGSLLGKTGTPSNQIAGISFPVNVHLTDEQFNPVASGTMPQVRLVSTDPLEEYVSANPNALVNGDRTFTMKAKTSTSTFSITASTDATTPVGTTEFKIGQSAGMRVWPAVAHHFTFMNLPSTATAGAMFNGTIVVKDQFENIISTGPNVYTGTIHFDAEMVSNLGLTDPIQNPILPPDYTFLSADAGIKNFVGGAEGNFILKKMGSRWLKASDFGDGNISTERPGYSTRPSVTVLPAAPFQFLFLSPVDLTDNVVDGQVLVSAGNLSNLGNVQLVAQLADQFNNSISTANYPVNFSVVNVLGSTGTVKRFNG